MTPPTEPSRRSRSARAREKKAASSSLLLMTGAFLVILCAILYGVYASHRDGNDNKPLESAQTANGDSPAAGNDTQAGDKPTGDAGTTANGQSNDGAASGGSSADSGNTAPANGESASNDGAVSAPDAGNGQSSGNASQDADAAVGNSESSPAKDPSQPDQAPASDATKGDKDAPASSKPTASSSTAASKLPMKYVVKKGDTLSTISMKFYRSKQYVAFLAKRNGIVFVNDMKPGDTITIPALTASAGTTPSTTKDADYSKVKLPATYLVRPGDTLYRISVLFYGSGKYASFLAKQNKLDEKAGLNAGVSLNIPVKPAA